MRLGRAAALAFAVVAAVSCTSGDDSISEDRRSAQTTTERASTGADHNDADARFAQRMIAQSEDAVAMATLADARASAPGVLELAAQIKARLLPELDALRQWLKGWEPDAKPDDTSMDTDAVSGRDIGTGLARLQATSDIEFDRAFLDLMVQHHTIAIGIAEEELAAGSSADALELARHVVEARKTETEQMQRLLGASSETSAPAP